MKAVELCWRPILSHWPASLLDPWVPCWPEIHRGLRLWLSRKGGRYWARKGKPRMSEWKCTKQEEKHTEYHLFFIFKNYVIFYTSYISGFPGEFSGQEPVCQCCRHKRSGFDPWVGMIPWRRAWQPTPVLLPGEFHGQRSPVGYSPWGRRVRHDWTANTTRLM